MKIPKLRFSIILAGAILVNTLAATDLRAKPSGAPSDVLLKEWYHAFMPTSPSAVRQLPFKLPDVQPYEVLTFGFVNFVATDQPLGGHPDNDIGDQARRALRQFLKSGKINDLFFNGEKEFSAGGPDIISDSGAIEERKKHEQAAIFWVRNKAELTSTIVDSVAQIWKPDSSTVTPPAIPDTLSKYLEGEFESLRDSLPEKQKTLLAGCRVGLGAPPNASASGESLWLTARSKILWLSPLLVKGLLLQSAQFEAESEYKRFLNNHGPAPRLLDDPNISNRVGVQFSNSLRFLLAHGIGHIVSADGSTSNAEIEKNVDQIVSTVLGKRDYSTLDSFLRQSIAASDNEAWGVEAPGDGDLFLKKLHP